MSGTQQRPLRGVRLPLVGPTGWGWVEDPEAADQAVRAVLLTEPGERIGRPLFGAGLRRFLFQPNSLETRTRMRIAVEEAMARDLPRLQLDGVEIATVPREPERVEVTVRFRIPGSALPQSTGIGLQLQGGG
ncbi:GPW/gp25 family protein [Falsiroseomonas oryzae]|uniref:GPW/gp25 family protein n=1 Tax=Falsiroseomonas oryzae TaxID=2766473 RepID=UPI0022EB841B|nr:GPW/gp25 family protein [Roseomonas sp. MO-31]